MADAVAPSSQVAVFAGGRRRVAVGVAVPRPMEVHGPGDLFDPLRVVGELRQRGNGDAEACLQAHVQGHGVNRLARADAELEARLAVGDEGDAGLRRAGRCGDRPRDCRHLGVHLGRLGDVLVPGHRLKADRLLDDGGALGLDDAADRSRRPAQGRHAKIAKLPVHDWQGEGKLCFLEGQRPGLAEGVLPGDGEGRRRSVEGEGVVDALPLGQGCRAPYTTTATRLATSSRLLRNCTLSTLRRIIIPRRVSWG